MAIQIKFAPLDRDIELMFDESFSAKARAAALAEFAREQIQDAQEINRAALGRIPRHTVTVDGRLGAPLAGVKPDGVVVAAFDVFGGDALVWVHEQLRLHSPVSEGRDPDPNVEYLDSHRLYADGAEVDVAGPYGNAREYVFVNIVPYAARIERGSSSQAPDGVYQVVAVLAERKFPAMKIGFEYRSFGSFPHMPAIVVTPRDR